MTFTRLAAAQLRNDLAEVLKSHDLASAAVSTLHSFALRQILYNSGTVEELPRPIRIADDWEERFIIQEDLKAIMGAARIEDVQDLISRLFADWETLKADETEWASSFPNPKFLGALQQHKTVYGETLRAELVYKLKRSLEQNTAFKLDNNYKFILIDEYQDLNACDLAVVRLLSQRGGTLFVVGDDDQSIYGFRYANPVGIRQFPEIYNNAARLQLSICYRCDKSIIRQAEFVADQDMQRLPKSTKPRDDANDGEVVLVQCTDQDAEAKAVANRIKLLIDGGVAADKIVILSKTRVIFGPIKEHVEAKGIKVSLSLGNELMATPEFRAVLSMLRLLADEHDSLALRTLIKIEKNGLGDKCVQALWQYASGKAVRLAVAIDNIRADPSLLGSIGAKVKAFRDKLETRLKQLKSIENVKDVVEKVVSESGSSALLAEKMRTYFSELIN